MEGALARMAFDPDANTTGMYRIEFIVDDPAIPSSASCPPLPLPQGAQPPSCATSLSQESTTHVDAVEAAILSGAVDAVIVRSLLAAAGVLPASRPVQCYNGCAAR
ncbi:hypothetical protein FOA52_011299 [Chlamydomonas sp. UWO 241]|nr:hypothetical protein FOA52_011299 [Chlamydomonas sp. UWO 241]